MDTDGWQIQLTEDLPTWRRSVVMFRRSGDLVEVVTGFDEHGVAVTKRVDPDARPSEVVAHIMLPSGVLEAIAEKLKPGESQGEVKRLEEALEVERRRVDQALDRRPHTIVVGTENPPVLLPEETRP